MAIIDSYIEKIYRLNVGIVGKGVERHERPHKPVMLLTVIDLIGSGRIEENRIEWNEDLTKRFKEIFAKVRKKDDKPTPENPFFYMRSEGFWRHVAQAGKGDQVETMSGPPLIGDLNRGIFHVELERELFELLRNTETRAVLREAIMARYFPSCSLDLPDSRVHEGQFTHYGVRSSVFRELILEAYDYQCAACGLRIRLPNGFTIVDAAHIVPFAESRNDHPTNGMALCKNHHWAFDRHLIAPSEDSTWRVSSIIEPRRGTGEAQLADLEGSVVLPPHDDAFKPSDEGVRWRLRKML